MSVIVLWLRAIFSSRTLPETMIAVEASEGKFLFSYVFCSLSSFFPFPTMIDYPYTKCTAET